MSAVILGIIATGVSLLAYIIRWWLTRRTNKDGMDRDTIERINATIKRSKDIKSLVGNLTKSERNQLLKQYFRK